MQARGPKRVLFDVWSAFYDLPWIQRAVYRAPHDAVAAELRASPCRSVLDVGCGTGLLAARLRRELPGSCVTGCDFSRGMLAQARAHDPAGAWVQGDAGRLPFRSGAFDAVVSTEAFHWFPDQRAALREFRRVLHPHGRIMLVLVNPRFAAAGRLAERASAAMGEPFSWPTAGAMRRQIVAEGFVILRQQWLFRLPGALLFPPVLTVAMVPRPSATEPRQDSRTRSGPRGGTWTREPTNASA
jgi:ubiquinone/menaquinone biosynthesis C-methylase UbiE